MTRLLVLLTLAACKAGDDATDDTSAPPASPCTDGSWGSLSDPTAALHVRTTGDDTLGDGSLNAPFLTVAAAVAAGRAAGAPYTLFIGPGTFSVTLELDASTDDGARFFGCGDETILEPESQSDPADERVMRVAGVTGMVIERMVTEGGDRPLWFWNGAEVTMRYVRVYRARHVGVLYDGVNTLATLEEVWVSDTTEATVGAGVAYGVSVRNLASFSMLGGGVENSVGVGLVVAGNSEPTGTTVTMSNVVISGVASDNNGLLGRGVQLQSVLSADLAGLEVSDSRDAGVYAVRVGALNLSDVVISAVSAGDVGNGEVSGEGIVVTGIDTLNTNPDPASATVTLSGNAVTEAPRVGILLERVTADVSANVATGGTADLAQQDQAVLNGAQAAEFTAVSGLGLNRESIATDSLTQ